MCGFRRYQWYLIEVKGVRGVGVSRVTDFKKKKKQVSQVPDKDGKTRRGIDCGETMVGFVLNTLTLSF